MFTLLVPAYLCGDGFCCCCYYFQNTLKMCVYGSILRLIGITYLRSGFSVALTVVILMSLFYAVTRGSEHRHPGTWGLELGTALSAAPCSSAVTHFQLHVVSLILNSETWFDM